MMSFIISCGELGVKRSENKFGLLSMLGRQNQMWDFFYTESNVVSNGFVSD